MSEALYTNLLHQHNCRRADEELMAIIVSNSVGQLSCRHVVFPADGATTRRDSDGSGAETSGSLTGHVVLISYSPMSPKKYG